MTKTELCYIAGNAYMSNTARRLNRCKSWYYIDRHLNAVALRSYNSIVAVCWKGIVWEFDRWSATTTSHVRKFAHLYGAPVVSLYRTSHMGIREFERHTACDWSDLITAQE